MSPIELLNRWLSEEEKAGAPNPHHAVLSTATQGAVPHGRVVAIREVTEQGLLFFTQNGSRKVAELTENPKFSIVFWLELHLREIILEGSVEPLSAAENLQYWETINRERQLRFSSYAPISSQPISSKEILAERKKQFELQHEGQPIPLSPYYCGFRLLPVRVMFYASRKDELSDVMEYSKINGKWVSQLLSP